MKINLDELVEEFIYQCGNFEGITLVWNIVLSSKFSLQDIKIDPHGQKEIHLGKLSSFVNIKRKNYLSFKQHYHSAN